MQEVFLSEFRALEPELCITAAYGNILPTKFLKIPSLGLCSFLQNFLVYKRTHDYLAIVSEFL